MTRINVGVDPKELPTKLLLAEHREITRIPNNVLKGKAVLKNIPLNFTLGKGHVRFFYNKLIFLKNRYISLYDELIKRNCNVTNKISAFYNIPVFITKNNKNYQVNLDYTPSIHDRNLIVQRINSRKFYLIENDYYENSIKI